MTAGRFLPSIVVTGATLASLGGCAQQLKTGQVACWDRAGLVISCAGTGQDGEIQSGLAREYEDNGDGTITDRKTGLVWEKKSDDGGINDKDNTYTWTEALTVFIPALNSGGGFAGHTDWRLPNINELASIVDYGQIDPALPPEFKTPCNPSCSATVCSCGTPHYHWSSTTSVPYPPYTGAWQVSFYDGYTSPFRKDSELSVRAVRGIGY